MGPDVVREVDAASLELLQRLELDARDIRHDGARERAQFPLDDVGDDIRRNRDDDERGLVGGRGSASGAVIDGETQLRWRSILEHDIHAQRAQRVPDAGAEETGTDDAHCAGDAWGQRITACHG